MSREKEFPTMQVAGVPGADALVLSGRPHPTCQFGETRRDPARSKTPSMHGHTSRGNREISRLSAMLVSTVTDRTGKSQDTRR